MFFQVGCFINHFYVNNKKTFVLKNKNAPIGSETYDSDESYGSYMENRFIPTRRNRISALWLHRTWKTMHVKLLNKTFVKLFMEQKLGVGLFLNSKLPFGGFFLCTLRQIMYVIEWIFFNFSIFWLAFFLFIIILEIKLFFGI